MQICGAEVTAQSTGGRLAIAKKIVSIMKRRSSLWKWHDGLPDQQRTFLGVEFDQCHRVNHGITIGCHTNVIALLEADSINVGNGL